MEDKRKYRKKGLAINAVLDTPEGQLVYLAQLNRELMGGRIKPELALASVRVVNAAQRSIELRDGAKVKVEHSGSIGIAAADGVFQSVFGGAEDASVALPTGVDSGPEQTEDMAQG